MEFLEQIIYLSASVIINHIHLATTTQLMPNNFI